MSVGNRTLRILVSVLTIPVILFITFYGEIPFLLFSLVIGTAAAFEFGAMMKHKESRPSQTVIVLISLAIILNFYFSFIEFINMFLIMIPVIMLVELFRNKGNESFNIGTELLAAMYIALSTGALLGIREIYKYNDFIYDQGGYLVIALFITIWICDSAAYFLGSAFGKHKLFPRVSPNKSWEGAIAGFIFSIMTMMFLQQFFLDFLQMHDGIIIGLIVGIFGQAGDLVESLLKRDAGVKDSSYIIPGHGGIFDRFDSIIFVSPLIYIYLTYL